MADREIPTVRIVQNTHDPNLKQVGLVSGTSGYRPNQIKQVYQAADVATHNLYETVQGITGAVTGLPTLCNLGIEGGGGGGGGYHAAAVHFTDNNTPTYVHNDALVSGATPKLSWALWYRQPALVGVSASTLSGFWVTDPEGAYASYAEVDQSTDGGGVFAPTQSGVQFSIGSPAGHFMASSSSANTGSTIMPPPDNWYASMGSIDCTDPDNPIILQFLNDQDVSEFRNHDNQGTEIAGNGVPIWIGNIAEGQSAYDMANFLMWYGTAIDWSSQAIRRKIISALSKPVDPANAITAFGTPTVALVGDKDSFANNTLGNGGPFSWVGTPTNASTSPSD